MNTKRCYKCDKDKDIDDFSFKVKAKGTRNAQCKECHSKLRRSHYQNNRQKYIDKAGRYKKDLANWYQSIKPDTCSKCGFKHKAVIDMHHIDDESKDLDVSRLIHYGNKQAVLDEMKKCIPLCANCHRIHHYNEKHASMVFNGSTKPFQG